MAKQEDESLFQLRCRNCGRTVFSAVRRISVRETRELLEHLRRSCRPGISLAESDMDAILAHFDVRKTSDG